MQVVRTLGHNAVLGHDDTDQEVIVMGRGIGFGIKPGMTVPPDRVEQVFRSTPTMSTQRLESILAEIPLEVVNAAAAIVDLAMRRLGVAVGPTVILPLADHLSQAIKRADRADDGHPLQWEIEQLYPDEYAVATDALTLAKSQLGVALPAGEAAAIALHFINARFAEDSLRSTVKMTQMIPRILQLVSQSAAIPLDQGSMNVTRFVTHLRYLFVRLSRDTQVTDLHRSLIDSIPQTNPAAYQIALRVQYLIESATGGHLSDSELAYLTLHLARLLADGPPPQPAPTG